jgi:hypothetical protein
MRRLLARPAATETTGAAPALVFPTDVLWKLYRWRGTIDAAAARESLGFVPVVPWRRGMELTSAWAAWSGLAESAP